MHYQHLRHVIWILLIIWEPSPTLAQTDYSTSSPLGLFADMAADTVTNALCNHFTLHPEMAFTVLGPTPGDSLLGRTTVLIALDFNNDGFEDIFQGIDASPGGLASRMLINQGDGTFAPLLGLPLSGSVGGGAAGDFDNDGWIDLILIEPRYDRPHPQKWIPQDIPKILGTQIVVLYNQEGKGFIESKLQVGFGSNPGRTLSYPLLADFNLDGFLDLVLSSKPKPGHLELMVFHGGPTGFKKGSPLPLAHQPPGAQSHQRLPRLATLDYDHDHDPDLMIQEAGYLPYRPFHLWFMLNDLIDFQAPKPMPAPTESRETPPIIADANNDGRLEFFFGVSDYTGGHNALLYRDDAGRYVDRGQDMGLWAGYNYTSNALWADLNNDGWLDLVECLYFNESAWTESRIYLNEAGSFFSNISQRATPDLGPGSLTAIAFDADHDGDVDIVLGHMTDYSDVMPMSATGLDLIRNDSAVGNWLEVKLEGTMSNRSSIGAEIRVFSAGKQWLQLVPNGPNWGSSQPPLTAHFGLAGLAGVDSVVVNWPGGKRENFGPQKTNSRLTLREGTAGKRS